MSRADTRRTLIAYDVPDDRRRLALAKALQSYGDRVQYSVFVVDASPVRLARLRRKLESLIDPALDSVLLCDLGLVHGDLDKRFVYVGRRRPITEESSFIL